jgi:hypothetical protein
MQRVRGFDGPAWLLVAGHVVISQTTMKILLMMVLLGGALVSSAPAADFYLGTWKITSAVAAPWQDGPPYQSDLAEMKSLVNKSMVIQAKAILGPRQVACKDPNYRIKDYSADMLFQGAFGEMHLRDKSADPAKIAATLGFRGSASKTPTWKTVETGCANELDFHFLDPTTAAFGLNNYVYMLKKQ